MWGSGFATCAASLYRRVGDVHCAALHFVMLDNAKDDLVVLAVRVAAGKVARRVVRLRRGKRHRDVNGRGQVILGAFAQTVHRNAQGEYDRDEQRVRPTG